ncbi:hypothetical protein AC1031_002131 [Aphanomyces cochlioides]|nr:hypothetical protein AC1031_002131 [Aphanomyces cochlioides]
MSLTPSPTTELLSTVTAALNDGRQTDEDYEVWTTLYNPDLGLVSSSAFGNATTTELEDPDMWSSIYNLLNKTSDDDPRESNDATAPPKPKRVRVYTYKSEVQHLETEICELQAQLTQAKRAVEFKSDASTWEAAAKQQLVEKNKSIQENQQLLRAILERNDYIARLQRSIMKPPRWMALPDVTPEDCSRSIPSDPALRIAANQRIADFQYSRMQTKFIQAGGFDLREDMCKGEPVMLSQQELGFLAVNHINIPAPYHDVAHAVWSVLSGAHAMNPSEHEKESWEQVDARTVYNKYWICHNGVMCHSNSVRKLYEESNRMAIVFATTLEDETVHRRPSDAIDDMNTWWQFTPNADNPSSSYMTIVAQSNISRLVEYNDLTADARDVVDILKRITAKIHSSPDINAPSFLKSFIDRRNRLRLPMQTAIQSAIREFQARTKLD